MSTVSNMACAALGAFIATMADLMAKSDVSTIIRVTEVLNVHLGVPVRNLYGLLLFVGIGTLLAWALDVKDKKTAVYTGLGVIAFVMTLVPNELPASLKSDTETKNGQFEGTVGPRGTYAKSAFGLIRVATAEQGLQTARDGQLNLYVFDSENRAVSEYVVTVVERNSGRVVGRSRFTQSFIRLSLEPGEYLIVVDAHGFRVFSQEQKLDGSTFVKMHVTLESTWVPEVVQRLLRTH